MRITATERLKSSKSAASREEDLEARILEVFVGGGAISSIDELRSLVRSRKGDVGKVVNALIERGVITRQENGYRLSDEFINSLKE